MPPLSRRRFLAAGAASLGVAAATGIWTWRIEPHLVEVVRRPMPLVGLPPALHGRTLLQLSDLHVGPVSSAYLIDTLREAALLRPDVVALTGDFVTYRSAAEARELARGLRHLPRGRLATVASLGNHDYGDGWRDLRVAEAVARVVADAGARVLRNEAIDVHGLQLAGLGDFWSPEFRDVTADVRGATDRGAVRLLRTLDPARPAVVLSHNPDSADAPVWGDVRGWVLAGHTHGGQCKPPFLPPPILPVRNTRYSAGAFDVGGGRTLYVNRGLGHLIRVRFNARPELTLFTLEPSTLQTTA
jgi:predicted MPP superfamily phosphohydrolase